MKYGRIIASLLLASTLSTAYAANNAQKVTVSKVNSNYAKTKYPVVFVHGMAGFIRAGDVLGLDYFRKKTNRNIYQKLYIATALKRLSSPVSCPLGAATKALRSP